MLKFSKHLAFNCFIKNIFNILNPNYSNKKTKNTHFQQTNESLCEEKKLLVKQSKKKKIQNVSIIN